LQLQALLQNLHYLGATAPLTGYFGPLTMNAVIAFQKANLISPAQGYVGPLTRKKLMSL
jgi:peptidoglycan hydrolase-like protein with peptidoglycan-binding domain